MLDTNVKRKDINNNVKGSEVAIKLPFIREDGLIFRLNYKGATGDHVYIFRYLAVLELYMKDILDIAYSNGYPGYTRLL